MRSLMNNMHTDFFRDSLIKTDLHTPRPRPEKRDIATLYSTDVSYQLERKPLTAQRKSELNSEMIVTTLMKFHQYTR